MLRVAIMDDEADFIEKFRPLVEQNLALHGFEFRIFPFTDGDQFRAAYLEEEFDLIFLDIDMPSLTGIEVASDLRSCNATSTLIFVSAHNHFVFESIRYAPFRFIRKEYVTHEIAEAMREYKKLYERRHHTIKLELEGEGTASVNTSQTAYFYAVRHSLFLYNSKKESLRLAARTYTMEKLEKLLTPHGFIRIHKSYLVNYSAIYQIQTDHILLTEEASRNGRDVLPLSRRRTAQVREQYRILMRGEAML